MLINILMLASQNQSIYLGLTEEKINDKGYGWVITQHILTVERLPIFGENIRVYTKAKSYNRYFCYRDFWIEDGNGTIITRMHSVFVLMDHKKRKIARLLPELVEPYGGEYTNKIERLANPLTESNAQYVSEKTYRVRFMDIDSNQHVNNVHYFDWMIDGLTEDFLLTHDLTEMNIKYKKEIHYGETVDSETSISENKLVTYHKISAENEESCYASCTWKSR
ncbi:acyl-acyl carrier protein thioesterase [Liquorilactobacillus cacaonum DSM 21116]|uniref:Acyl-acyl carrier protein thioesterase n=2 Tax=Liquorilactobacillus cacaonum TaxID=483012 RepID=A0A0R2CQF6_9LACO|nr:acyl-acyl carrier protein thioesterase [Liquorilactobacillus cacaonum DSM 21116]